MMDAKYGLSSNLQALAKSFQATAAPTPEVRQIPVHTRGIGLLTAKAYMHVKNIVNYSVTPKPIDVNMLYRVGLLQLQQKLYATQKYASRSCFPLPAQRFAVPKFQFNKALTPVSMVVSEFGSFRHEGIDHLPYVPDYSATIAESDDPPPTRRARVDVGIGVTNIDPYGVTILNLRDKVRLLANPAVPVAVRKAFHDKSPIPGAKWENHLLLNPDEIIDEDYLAPNSRLRDKDYNDYGSLIKWLSIHHSSAVSDIASDKGSVSQLIGVDTGREQFNTFTADDVRIDFPSRGVLRSSTILDPHHYVVGHATLLGELPPYRQNEVSHWMRTEIGAVTQTVELWSDVANLFTVH